MEPIGMIEPELLVATCQADGRILSRNQAWTRLMGSGDTLWERLLDTDRETAEQNFREAAGGSLVTHALFMVNRAGRDIPVPVLLHFVPVTLQSSGTAGADAVSISGEILAEPTSWTESQTERHRMETLGRMTMGMAHDFNNLLAGIMGHIELWRSESDSESGNEHADTIEQAARDGADLIQRVQRYIRQERRADFEPVDLNALIADCVSFTRPYWYNEPRRQGISIEFDQDVEALPPINGSPSELRDVFVNLILNAVHALPEGGTITIRGRTDDGTVRIDVQDDGTGMSSSVKERIFEPLYSTKGERGTGMGLAVVAGVVREHDGQISVDSELGEGTTISLVFPSQQSEDTTREPKLVSRDTAPAVRVLVVDDEAMVRRVVSRLLTLRGHTVISAESGRQAVEILQEEKVDIIFTDQGMPQMSGRELAHHCARLAPDTPVVLLTGDTDLTVDPSEIRLVLTKPFEADDLQSAIASLV